MKRTKNENRAKKFRNYKLDEMEDRAEMFGEKLGLIKSPCSPHDTTVDEDEPVTLRFLGADPTYER